MTALLVKRSMRLMRERSSVRTHHFGQDTGMEKDTPKMTNPIILCKPCNRKMTRLEWMKNTACDNPDCRCPEIKKAMKATQVAIKRAQSRGGEEVARMANTISTKSTPVPNGRDENIHQLYIDIPQVITIDISPKRKK